MTRRGYAILAGAAVVAVAALVATGAGILHISGEMEQAQESLRLATKIDTLVHEKYSGASHVRVVPDARSYNVDVRLSVSSMTESLLLYDILKSQLTDAELAHVRYTVETRVPDVPVSTE
jgi:hypothetical protein